MFPARRSSRPSAAVLSQAPLSPLLSPKRATRSSLAPAQTPTIAKSSPAQPAHTPGQFCLTLEQTPALRSRRCTPRAPQSRRDAVNLSLCFSPVKEAFSDKPQAEQSLQPPPTESVCMQEAPAAAVSVEEGGNETEISTIPLSPRRSPMPCKSPPDLQAPEPPSSLSFTLLPRGSPGCTPVEVQPSVCHTPNSSVTEVSVAILSPHPRMCSLFAPATIVSCTFRNFLIWILSATSSLPKDAACHQEIRLLERRCHPRDQT